MQDEAKDRLRGEERSDEQKVVSCVGRRRKAVYSFLCSLCSSRPSLLVDFHLLYLELRLALRKELLSGDIGREHD